MSSQAWDGPVHLHIHQCINNNRVNIWRDHISILFQSVPRPPSTPSFQHTATSICSSLKHNSKPPPMFAPAKVLLAAPLLLATATSAQTVTLIESLPFSTNGITSDADPATFTLIPLEVSEVLRPWERVLIDQVSMSVLTYELMELSRGAGWRHKCRHLWQLL